MKFSGIQSLIRRILFAIAIGCFFFGCYRDIEQRSVTFSVIDADTGLPLEGAEVFVTDFTQHLVFDWDMHTERWGITDYTGKVTVSGLSNRNDSIRIVKEDYLRVSVVLNDKNELIFVYRTRDDDELVQSDIVSFDEFDTIPMIPK